MPAFRRSIATALVTTMSASSAMGFALGAMPSETVGAVGEFLAPAPTEAPSMELMKAKLAKKSLTNVCSEWTIPGGFGQPQCYNSQTCLFKTATNGYFYEGCGQTSIAYDWVTACFNYPQSGTPPVSEIYCPKSAPYCGYYAFIFDVGYTFYNFGCSSVSYGLVVERVETTSGASSSTLLAGGGVTSSSTTRSTSTSTSRVASTTTAGVSSSSSSSKPTIGSHKKKKVAKGAIIGAVIGGVVVIAIAAFLVWFFLRKKKQDRLKAEEHEAQVQQQQADAASAAAFQNHQRMSEMGGPNVKPFIEAFAPSGGEKPAPVGAAELHQSPQHVQQGPNHDAYGNTLHANSQQTPSMYGQQQPSPATTYNELATPQERPISVPPVSPLGTMTSQSTPPQVYQQPHQQQQPYQTLPTELVADNRQSPPLQHMYQQYPPPPPQQQMYAQPTELVGENRMPSPPPPARQVYQPYQPPSTQQQPQYQPGYQPQPQPTELGGENRGSWQTPQGVQEIGAGVVGAGTPRPPPGPPPGHVVPAPVQPAVQTSVAEMSATATGHNPRPPQGRPPGHGPVGGVDMSGAPMSENWNGRHELE